MKAVVCALFLSVLFTLPATAIPVSDFCAAKKSCGNGCSHVDCKSKDWWGEWSECRACSFAGIHRITLKELGSTQRTFSRTFAAAALSDVRLELQVMGSVTAVDEGDVSNESTFHFGAASRWVIRIYDLEQPQPVAQMGVGRGATPVLLRLENAFAKYVDAANACGGSAALDDAAESVTATLIASGIGNDASRIALRAYVRGLLAEAFAAAAGR
jgi:hypothetical protein